MSKKNTTDADRLRTVYMSTEDRETLHSVASVQDVPASTITRSIFNDYLSGKLKVTPAVPHKTSILIDDDVWAQVMAKTKADGLSIRKVLAAGIARLRARR
jgi:hypothetical protein